MSTLRGLPLISASVHIPPAGGWFASVVLSSGGAPELGPADLVIGDLTLRGAVVRGGVDTPDAPSAVVVGGAGWRTLLAREGRYAAPSGVRLSTVLADLARLAGETYDAPADAQLGPAYEWPATAAPSVYVRADAVLADLVVRGAIPTWRMDPATGRTRFDAWPATGSADGIGQILDRDMQRGIRYLGLDSRAAALLPGAAIEGETVSRLILASTADALRAEVWTTAAPTLRSSVRRILHALLPWLPHVRVDAAGDLAIRSASTRVHLAGDKSDPAVARVGDFVVRLYLDSVTGMLYASTSAAAPYTWAPVASGIIPPTSADAGTAINVVTGSEKVTCK